MEVFDTKCLHLSLIVHIESIHKLPECLATSENMLPVVKRFHTLGWILLSKSTSMIFFQGLYTF